MCSHSVMGKLPIGYIPQLLMIILVDEICNNYFLNIFSSLSKSSKIEEFVFYVFFLIVQIFLSPIQAGYSDFYCRKKGLILSLSFSAVSVIPAFLYFQNTIFPILLLSLICIIKGAFGNNIPLAWAGIADTQTKNVRLSLAFSGCVEKVGLEI